MMGLGSLGNGVMGGGGGTSSSFSNLSPLAPPFTVDRSNSKPGSTQLLNFSDSAYTGSVPFGQSWTQYAAASGSLSPDFTPSDSVKHTSNNLWSTSNPTVNTSSEAYSFGGEGYYAPYVPSVVSDDHHSSAFSEAAINVLPNSENMAVNVSSQVDYTQSLSGLEYPVSHWSFFSKVADGKQDERKGVDGSFSLGKVNAGASFGYGNCISQGDFLLLLAVVSLF